MAKEEEKPDYVGVGEFRINKIVLVDSLCAGDIVEFPINGGAVLTGRNGRGKTSLLQLLLLFFGESPNRIVTTEAGRSSFIGYYLPRTTSYIAFEYQRPDGEQRMTVAYADRHGEKVFFRLVRHGFSADQFLDHEDEFVLTANFARHLRLLGYDFVERQIETLSDYRSIIQFTPTCSDRQHQRYLTTLAHDYGFTTPKHPLKQIEKIVTGMFRRKTNFDDLQSMVIDCVTEEGDQPTIAQDRSKVEDWPRTYRAYMETMANPEKIERIIEEETALQAAELGLGEIRTKASQLVEHLNSRRQEAASALDSIVTERHRALAVHQTEHQTLDSQRLQHENIAQIAQNQVELFDKQAAEYDRIQIESLSDRLSCEPDLRDKSTALAKRKEALLGEQSNISNRYEQQKFVERERFADKKIGIDREQQITRDACEHDILQIDDAFNEEELWHRTTNAEQLVVYDEQVEFAAGEVSRLKQHCDHPVPDLELAARVENKRSHVDAIQQSINQINPQLIAAGQEYDACRQAYDQEDRHLQGATQELASAEEFLQRCQKLLYPDDGTLLAFLREYYPEWGESIAKVINPELLDRTDLSPALSEDAESLYGLDLSLDRLTTHPAANIDDIQATINTAEERLSIARVSLEEAKKRLQKADSKRKDAETACLNIRLTLSQFQQSLASAHLELDDSKRQLEQSNRVKHDAAKRDYKAAESVQGTAKQARRDFVSQVENARLERNRQYEQQKKNRRAKRDHEIGVWQKKLDQAQVDLNATLTQMDKEMNDALRQKGINVEALSSIDNNIKTLEAELTEIAGFREQVLTWRHWLVHEWPRRSIEEKKAKDAKTQAKSVGQVISEKNRSWEQRLIAFDKQIQQLQKTISDCQSEHNAVVALKYQLDAYPEVLVEKFDPSWSFDALNTRMGQLRNEAKQCNDRIRSMVAERAAVFRKYSGSAPDQYLIEGVSTLSPGPSRDWIAPLQEWYRHAHKQTLQVLLTEVGSIAGSVSSFHDTMDKFHHKVLQFNRELQGHLDSSLDFDSISAINVEVISSLNELKFWPIICEVNDSYRHWQGRGGQELPPPEFAQRLETLLEHWEVRGGIRTDYRSLIRIQGTVVENGNYRVFKRAADLEAVSSNGLSYLVLATIFVGFINRIRRDAPVNIVWALDELMDLDVPNVVSLIRLLKRNRITLACAFPNPDPDALILFSNQFIVQPNRQLATVMFGSTMTDLESEKIGEVQYV